MDKLAETILIKLASEDYDPKIGYYKIRLSDNHLLRGNPVILLHLSEKKAIYQNKINGMNLSKSIELPILEYDHEFITIYPARIKDYLKSAQI